MKNKISVQNWLLLLSFLLTGCIKDAEQNPDLVSAKDLQETPSEKSTTATAITKITSTAPCDNCASSTASKLKISWLQESYELVIDGSNFGATSGKIALTDPNGRSVSSYSLRLKSWSNTQIRVFIGAAVSALPSDLTLTITTATNATVRQNIPVIPVIRGKVFGTSPYYVNQRRIQLNLQPLPLGLSTNPSGSLNANYVPTRGDAWLLSKSALSVVTAVSGPQITLSSKSVAGSVERVVYQVSVSELSNGKETTLSREIAIKRTTTISTNAPRRVTNELITTSANAFATATRGVAADAYYR